MLRKKSIILISGIFLIFLLSINLIFSQQITVTDQNQPKPKPSFWGQIWSTITSPIFIGIVLFFVVAVIVAVLTVFIIKWIVGFFKQKSNVYLKLKKNRIKLAKVHRSFPSRHWWRVSRNTPIRLVRKNNNRLTISDPVAYHRGDYTGHEGNILIAMNMVGMKKFFFFPITDLLIIPNREQVDLKLKNEKGEEKEITIKNLPRSDQIVQFNEGEILIFAESLSMSGEFYVPVLKSQSGKIIDLSMPIYESFKDVILEDYLYNQSGDFVDVAKKHMDLNPYIRSGQRLSESNQNIEIPDGTVKK